MMLKEILIATQLILYMSGMIAFAKEERSFISDSTYSHVDYEQHSYFSFADSLGANNKVFEAVAAYKSAMDKFSGEKDFRGHITASCKMAGMLTGLRQFPEAKEALDEAFRSFRHIPDDSIFLSHIYYRRGVLYEYLNKPDSALFFLNHALTIRKNIVGDHSQPVAACYLAIADIHQFVLLDPFNSLKYYLGALEIRESSQSSDQYRTLANICYRLSITYRQLGDTEKAVTYAQQARTYYERNDNSDFLNQAFCQIALANIFFDMLDFSNSLKHYLNAIELLKLFPQYTNIYLPTYYSNLAATYLELDEQDSAAFFLDQAMVFLEKDQDSVQMVHTLEQIGNVHMMKKQYETAREYYQRSLRLSQMVYGKFSSQNAYGYIKMAEYHESVGNYREAVVSLEKVLKVLEFDPSSPDPQTLNSPDRDYKMILETLALLASVQFKDYQSNLQEENLQMAYNNYQIIDKLLTYHRNALSREMSVLESAKKFKRVYEEALDCAFTLYQLTPTASLANTVFRFMEKNKALILMEFLRNAEVNHADFIPDSIRSQEELLTAQYRFYSAQLQESRFGDEDYIDLQNSLFLAERHLEKLKSQLNEKFPEYFKIKYENKFITLQECQKFLQSKDALLIEYFQGESAIYALGVTSEKVSFKKFTNLAEVDSLIAVVTRSLQGDFNIQQAKADFQQFSGSAYHLYDFLMAPVFREINMTQPKTNLIIVPDGNLSFVPFEALVEKRPVTSGMAFHKLAYLVHRFSISYAFSTQVLVQSLKLDKSPVSALVFSYEEKNLAPNSGTELSIKGTSEEAEFISSIMPTVQFSGSMATKSNFIKHSEEAGIIHLALHGQANPVNPLKGAIQFRRSDEPPKDEYLYYYELLNMQLKARLTVLSACETGIGEFMDGEGVYHIARGFRYAGCPTLVASLWKINDQSTAKLVQYFYKNLMDEKEMAIALQESKRQYINDADELLAHPRYWAGMVLIGNTDPFNPQAAFNWGYWGIIGMVFLLLLFFVKCKYQ